MARVLLAATVLLGIVVAPIAPNFANDADAKPADTKSLAKTGASIAKAPSVVEQGKASYYNDSFQGKPTASGVPEDQNALTAASKDLPLGAKATVTNLENGKSVDVEVNDRGPYKSGRVIDLSKRAANDLGIDRKKGVAPVVVKAKPADQPTPELQEKVAEAGAAKQAAQTTKTAAAKSLPVTTAPAKTK